MQSTEAPVIIENSSFTCRAGLESEKGPSVCIPTIVGEKRDGNQQSILIGNQINDEMVDYELFYPIEFGMIKDWKRMELIWQHIFEKELKVKSENHATLITQAPRTPKHIKEQMAETMFEKFKVPSFHISNQSVLTLYSSGRTTGTVLESGDGVTYSLPIYEGYILKHALQRINIGGRNCSSQLLRLINDSKIIDLEQSKRMKIINEIKEQYCYVALDPEKEEQKFKNNPSQKFFYYLPDGNEIVIKNQAYLCTEILFQPHKAQFEFDGLHEIVNRSIQNSDFDLWSKLYENILLSGGNCLFSGLQERLQSEISNLSPKSLKIRVISHPNKLNSTWLGGSILSTLSTFQSFWVSKSEYEEMGSRALFIKCF